MPARPMFPRAIGSASAAGGGGGAPSGNAGGSLSGTYPNPGIAAGAVGPTELATSAVDVSTTKVTGVLAAGRFPALTGDVTTSAGALATAIGNGRVVAAMLAAGAVDLSTSVATGIMAAARMPALTGDVTTSAGAVATSIAANAVTLAKLATQAAGTILGNATTSTAVPTALSTAAAQNLLRNQGEWMGSDNGALKAATGDPVYGKVPVSTLLVASTTYTAKVWLTPGTYTNFGVIVDTVGATLTATTFCFYLTNSDATGTLVTNSGSADAASVWTTAGYREIALGTPLVVTVGAYYFINVRIGAGTTMPKVATGAHGSLNAGCGLGTNVAPNAANVARFGNPTNNPTGITPPATSGNIIEGANAVPFWVGLT